MRTPIKVLPTRQIERTGPLTSSVSPLDRLLFHNQNSPANSQDLFGSTCAAAMPLSVPCQHSLYWTWQWRPLWLLLLLQLTVSGLVDAWNPPSSSPLDIHNVPVSRTTLLSNMVGATTGLLLLVSPTGDFSRDAACAASAAEGNDADDFVRSITQSLSPPTEERPPIALPNLQNLRNDSNNNNNRQRTTPSLPSPQRVEALITLENPQQRPSPSDILVIQVYESRNCQQLLGGARVPIARIRFPIQVQLTSANAKSPSSSSSVSGVEVWNTLTSSQDLWMVANVCPGGNGVDDDGNGRTTCLDPQGKDILFQATGISKFLTTLPGLQQDSLLVETMGQKGLRLPATLALKRL